MAINETATGNDSVAVTGTASAGDRTVGVKGIGDSVGVLGVGKSWHGVEGSSDSTIGGFGVHGVHTKGGTGVVGESTGWIAVGGFATAESKGAAVYGEHKGLQAGVWGNNLNDTNDAGPGVVGTSKTVGVKGIGDSVGVLGVGKGWHGVEGSSDSTTGGFGVHGVHTKGGTGVVGESTGWIAVGGFATAESKGAAVYGEHKGLQAGVWGNNLNDTNDAGAGVVGESKRGVGVWAKGGRLAGLFEGDVEVTGDIRLANADCAEDFDIASLETVEPGTVMVITEGGALQPSQHAYDKRVAGVISGAGDYKPGIVLDKQHSQPNRKPIALLGKVYCNVDAGFAPIEVGDLLTTSPTPGHAMKADDPLKAFGSIIGKALRPFKEGQGLVPILIALQ